MKDRRWGLVDWSYGFGPDFIVLGYTRGYNTISRDTQLIMISPHLRI